MGEALRWYGDEVLFSEGDLIGKTAAQLRALHFRRDRDYFAIRPDLSPGRWTPKFS